MSNPRLHVRCADLHPGCPTHLWGASAEEIVLAYVLHHADGHTEPQVELDDLLDSVGVCLAPREAARTPRDASRAPADASPAPRGQVAVTADGARLPQLAATG